MLNIIRHDAPSLFAMPVRSRVGAVARIELGLPLLSAPAAAASSVAGIHYLKHLQLVTL